MITINQPKVVATEQNYKVASCNINFLSGVIEVSFGIFNENGKRIGSVIKEYKGADANTYWTDFVNKQFMYEKLVEEENLNVVVPSIPDVLVE